MASNDEVPKIVLLPHSRSHPFAQRECVLSEPLKVGRPVDKKKISQNNLIFDCRVLSRNHALIWFENGKFFIRDTKSSNGTFVNECRLSPSGEESSPTEMRTRDIVQFGVNVNVEKKVTHGCIIATVKLFINDKELPGPDPDIQQVMAIVQSALIHEQEVETKLAFMQEVLVATHNLANDSMISIVKEDELLSRLEMLENQLQVYSKTISEDELRKQLTKSYEDKHKREIIAKETIQKMLQEKIDTSSKLSQLQRDYDKAEEECQRYRTLYESLKHEHSQQVSKLNDLVKASEKQRMEEDDKNKAERDSLKADQETLQLELEVAKNELDITRLRLKETKDELLEAKESLESTNRGKIYQINNEVQSNDSALGNSGSETGRIVEVAMLESSTTSSLFSTNPNPIPNAENKEDSSNAIEGSLKDELKLSEERVASLTSEINILNKAQQTLQRQVEELKAQLQDKAALEERKSSAVADMKETIDYQKTELDKLRTQIKSLKNSQEQYEAIVMDSTDLPTNLEQCQSQLMEMRRHTELMEGKIRDKEIEMSFIVQEKNGLEERLSTLEVNHSRVTEESRRTEAKLQNELLEAQSETKSLTSQLQLLQDTLNDTVSPTATSSSEVSLLEAPPPPDPRLRVLSVITLVSLAIALISTAFAYFF